MLRELRQVTDQEKIFENHISDKGIVPRMKNLTKQNKKKTDILIKK